MPMTVACSRITSTTALRSTFALAVASGNRLTSAVGQWLFSMCGRCISCHRTLFCHQLFGRDKSFLNKQPMRKAKMKHESVRQETFTQATAVHFGHQPQQSVHQSSSQSSRRWVCFATCRDSSWNRTSSPTVLQLAHVKKVWSADTPLLIRWCLQVVFFRVCPSHGRI